MNAHSRLDFVSTPVWDRSDPDHPDRALLDLCDRLAAMAAEWQRLYDATSEEPELTTPADFAWQAYNDDVWPRTALQSPGSTTPDIPAMLISLHAITLEGMRAKAAAILAMNDAGDYSHDIRDDSFELSLSLLEDVAGMAPLRLGEDAHVG